MGLISCGKTNLVYCPPLEKHGCSREKKNIHRRMIKKNGICNVKQPRSHRQRFFVLSYEKLVDSSWTITLSIFLAVLFLSWTCFAIFYWLICFTHGDFEPNHLPEVQKINRYKYDLNKQVPNELKVHF